MARKRMIDPNFWRDEKVARCNSVEKLLFIGLWNFAEDNGVGRANPLLIRADIFPYDDFSESDIQTNLEHLASLKLIQLYKVEEQTYYFITNFAKHQTINKPTPCHLPLPEDSCSTTVVLPSQVKLSKENIREDK